MDQSPDGTNYDVTDAIDYWPIVNGVAVGGAWTVQAVNSYVRVRVKNIDSAITTYIRLQTALCPVVEAVPRTLDADGLFKTAINRIRGPLGNDAQISPQGNLRTTHSTRLAGSNFTGTTLDTNFWSTTGSTGTGGAGATTTGGEVIVTTGTTANATGRVTSVRYGRYVAGASNYVRHVVRLPAVTGANVRKWGGYDDNDGFYFMDDYSDGANHVLKVVCRKGGSDTNTISSGAFNGPHGTSYTLDANYHTYEIYWSGKKTYFLIDDVLIHTFSATTASLSATLTVPIRVESINSGANTNANTIVGRNLSLNRLGLIETDTKPGNIVGATGAGGTVLKYGAGRLHRITINNNPVNGQTITVYDNTSAAAPTIATITLTTGNNANSSLPVTLEYGCPFSTGLTVVTVNASSNITVIYE